jgi:predicted MPP superfamily phosphohydrolase
MKLEGASLMILAVSHLPSMALLAVTLALHALIWRWAMTANRVRSSIYYKCLVTLATGAFVTLLLAGFSLHLVQGIQDLPVGNWVFELRGIGLAWALCLPWIVLAIWLWRKAPAFDEGRRRVLKATGAVALSVPAAVGGLGSFVALTAMEAREVEIHLDGLPPDMDGLRIAQLTDIHLGPFLSEKELVRAVGMANEWRPHLAFVTGDLITDRGDPLDLCLQQLAKLRPSDGIFGCLGNHEGYIRAGAYCAREGYRLGIRFLRSETRYMRFGRAGLNLAGVDYQRRGGPYLAGLDHLLRKDRINFLLSHNPDAFPAAVKQGYRFVISGHTHGGQVSIDGMGISLNFARLFTRYVHGLYLEKDSAMYVSRGIGTVGIPVRLGAAPEVTLIRLRCS